MQKLLDQVEDQRSAGKSLKDIGQTMKLQFYEIPATDRDNKAPDGKPALDHRRMPAASSRRPSTASVGVENDAIELSDGGYAWVDVLDIIDAKQKPFEEVKADVKTA